MDREKILESFMDIQQITSVTCEIKKDSLWRCVTMMLVKAYHTILNLYMDLKDGVSYILDSVSQLRDRLFRRLVQKFQSIFRNLHNSVEIKEKYIRGSSNDDPFIFDILNSFYQQVL